MEPILNIKVNPQETLSVKENEDQLSIANKSCNQNISGGQDIVKIKRMISSLSFQNIKPESKKFIKDDSIIMQTIVQNQMESNMCPSCKIRIIDPKAKEGTKLS